MLVCSDHLFPAKGGGNISIKSVARRLRGAGYEVEIAYIEASEDPEFKSHPVSIRVVAKGLWPRLWLTGLLWRPAMRRIIRESRPDVVIAQQTVALPAVSVCVELGVPVILFLRNLDDFCLGGFWAGKGRTCDMKCLGCQDAGPRRWQFPLFRITYRRTMRLIRSADAVVSNSDYIARTLKELWGLDSIVLLPEIDPPRERSSSDRRKILFFSPVPHKGSRVAVEIARRLPEEEFLFVGDADYQTLDSIRRLTNVEYVPWTEDTGEAFEKAWLLIVPSLFPEAFGRVCLEAMSLGIPCLVSSSGALPETVGDGGTVVQDRENPEAWIDAISQYRESGLHSERSRKAKSVFKRYLERDAFDALARLIDQLSSR